NTQLAAPQWGGAPCPPQSPVGKHNSLPPNGGAPCPPQSPVGKHPNPASQWGRSMPPASPVGKHTTRCPQRVPNDQSRSITALASVLDSAPAVGPAFSGAEPGSR